MLNFFNNVSPFFLSLSDCHLSYSALAEWDFYYYYYESVCFFVISFALSLFMHSFYSFALNFFHFFILCCGYFFTILCGLSSSSFLFFFALEMITNLSFFFFAHYIPLKRVFASNTEFRKLLFFIIIIIIIIVV
jgi:hypothetical protein